MEEAQVRSLVRTFFSDEVAPTCYRAAESQISDDEFWRQMCERIRKSKDTLSVSDIAAVASGFTALREGPSPILVLLDTRCVGDSQLQRC